MVFDDPSLAPYRGRDPYIFISYSHRNASAAAEIIRSLNLAGFRVWYDEGLIPGREWDDDVAHIILGCSYFIPLISREYLASNNCRDELNYARDKEKPMMLIYLEDVDLPAGMELRLGRIFAVRRSAFQSTEAFYAKVFSADGIAVCNRRIKTPSAAASGRNSSSAKKKKSAAEAETLSENRPRSREDPPEGGHAGPLIGAVLILMLVAAALVLILRLQNRDSDSASVPTTSVESIAPDTPNEAEFEIESTPTPVPTPSPTVSAEPTPSPTPGDEVSPTPEQTVIITPPPPPEGTPAPEVTVIPSEEIELPAGQSTPDGNSEEEELISSP